MICQTHVYPNITKTNNISPDILEIRERMLIFSFNFWFVNICHFLFCKFLLFASFPHSPISLSCRYYKTTIRPNIINKSEYFPNPLFRLNFRMVNSLVYYGLSLGTGVIGGDPYINFCIAGGVEIPAKLLCIASLNKLGRRWPLFGTMALSGIGCIVCGFISSGKGPSINLGGDWGGVWKHFDGKIIRCLENGRK